MGVGEERESRRGGSVEVYIVFGKIQAQCGGQRPAHAPAARRGQRSSVVYWIFLFIFHLSSYLYIYGENCS